MLETDWKKKKNNNQQQRRYFGGAIQTPRMPWKSDIKSNYFLLGLLYRLCNSGYQCETMGYRRLGLGLASTTRKVSSQ